MTTGPTTVAAEACPFCGSASVPHIAAPDRNRRASRQVFHLRRCVTCGLIFLTDAPHDLRPFYTSGYHHHVARAQDLEPLLGHERYKIETVQTVVRAGALLEIGPSVGVFARLAQQAGFVVSAIEVDPQCVRFLQDELGIRAIESADPAAVLENDTTEYDAICLWHSLEHVPRPWAVIAAAARRLAPGGTLVVAAPNPYARQARLLGSFWPHWDLPRHLHLPSVAWLQARARAAGLVVVSTTTCDQNGRDSNAASWAMLGRRAMWGSTTGWNLGATLAGLIHRWEDVEGHGAAYTAVFQRPAP